MPDKILTSDEFFRDCNFPLSVIKFTHTGSDDKFHAHEFYELVIVTGGNAVHHVNRLQYEIGCGDVFIIPRGVEHRYSNVDTLMLLNIIYKADFLPIPVLDMKNFIFFETLFRKTSQLASENLQVLLKLDAAQIKQAVELAGSVADQRNAWSPGSQFCSIAAFMLLVGKLSQWHHLKQNAKAPIYTIGKALDCINNHYNREIGIAELTRLAGMSRRTLFRRFTEAIGMSPGYYLQQVRMRHAAELLRQTSLPISEVATDCGFKDSNFFSKQFRKIMKTSPRRYRKIESGDKDTKP